MCRVQGELRQFSPDMAFVYPMGRSTPSTAFDGARIIDGLGLVRLFF